MTGTMGSPISLRSTESPSQWTLDLTGGAGSADYVDVMDAAVAATSFDIVATNSVDSGNNDTVSPGWLFGVSQTLTWLGPVGGAGSWDVAGNWSPASVPTAIDDVFIDPGGQPTLACDAATRNLTILAGATLFTAGHDLTINGIYQNDGTLVRGGGGRVSQTGRLPVRVEPTAPQIRRFDTGNVVIAANLAGPDVAEVGAGHQEGAAHLVRRIDGE